MEYQQPESPPYIEKVHQLNQAIFYCYNESSERIPVNRINGFNFKDDQTLYFNTNYFPLTESAWNIFAGELHFYKKGIPYSIILHGVAVISTEEGRVEFSIQHAEYFKPDFIFDRGLLSSLFKPYIHLYRKSSELLMHTFKRKSTTDNLNEISANA